MVSLKNKQNIYVAKKVIDLEIEALKRLKNKINSSFNDAVEAIVNCKSKVVLSGVGKSGLISLKNCSNFIISWHSFILSICKRLFSWGSRKFIKKRCSNTYKLLRKD